LRPAAPETILFQRYVCSCIHVIIALLHLRLVDELRDPRGILT
jgi:hypothetical protein